MTFFGGLFKGMTALLVSVLATGLFATSASPTASFKMAPDGNPVVGQTVQFTDTSTGGPTSWSWDFGDGQTSAQQNPAHAYGGPGSFNVTLMASNTGGLTQQVQAVVVTPIDTLQLNNKGGHPFIVKLVATNQHDNNVQGVGQAIPQNDLFGYFSFPSLTHEPDNPEVFVKILDGRVVNGEFWVFHGQLTDLIYDLTVTEVSTGYVKTYHKRAGSESDDVQPPDPPVGERDADTSGFHPTPAPTPPPSSSTTIVNVGQFGTAFTDTKSGNALTTIHVGDTVKWVFVSSMQHSTSSGSCTSGGYYGDDVCTADGQWDSGLMVSPSTFSHTFTSAGTYRYYCDLHKSAMTGSVVVQP